MQKNIITGSVLAIALVAVFAATYILVSRLDATDQKVTTIIQFISNAQQRQSVSATK